METEQVRLNVCVLAAAAGDPPPSSSQGVAQMSTQRQPVPAFALRWEVVGLIPTFRMCVYVRSPVRSPVCR